MNKSSSTRRLRHREADLAGLLQAAERVFSDRGYHNTSIRDIAREAGFSVGGVYQFFESKDDLYLKVVEGQWEHFFAILNSALQADTVQGRLTALTDAMFRAYEERAEFFKLFLSDRGRLSASFTGEIASRIGQHTRRLRQELVELMRQGIAEGLLQPLDPDMLASAYLGIVHNCIFEALASGAPKPLRPAADLLGLFMGGAAGLMAGGHPHGMPGGRTGGHPGGPPHAEMPGVDRPGMMPADEAGGPSAQPVTPAPAATDVPAGPPPGSAAAPLPEAPSDAGPATAEAPPSSRERSS